MYLCLLHGLELRPVSVDGSPFAHLDEADTKGVRNEGGEIQSRHPSCIDMAWEGNSGQAPRIGLRSTWTTNNHRRLP